MAFGRIVPYCRAWKAAGGSGGRLAKPRRLKQTLVTIWLLSVSAIAPGSIGLAATFDVPADGSTLVGQLRVVRPTHENTLLDVARHFDVGYHEITWANPAVNVWMPSGEAVVVPAQFILPSTPWKGIVLNISQRRLFYFPTPAPGQQAQVITFPVSIAREGWSTPLGQSKIVAKHKDPAWFVPKSIRAEHVAQGEAEFPEYFPPGPNNPMGMLAIQTGFPGIYIHGTNRPWGVGMRTSHGCLHLYPEDAATLFPLMKEGIPLRVIDEPFVVGHRNGQVMMASYEPVAEYGASSNLFTRAVLALLPYLEADAAGQSIGYDIAWEKVQEVVSKKTVVPMSVSPGGRDVAEVIAEVPVETYDLPPYGVDANDASLPVR